MTQKRQSGLFDRWYGGKKFFKLAFKKKCSPLSFHERLVYSYIVFRTAHRGATRGEVVRATRLHRTTVPKVLSHLITMRLAEDDGDRYLALRPEQQDWFAWKADASKPWHERLWGYRICHTPQGWTPMQNAVYFCLLSDNMQEGQRIRRSQRMAGIAAMLGLSHDTVERTYKMLRELKLLEHGYLRTPPAEVLAIFADRKKAGEEPWMASTALGWKFPDWQDGPLMATWIDKATKKLEKAGYTKDDIVAYWTHIGRFAPKPNRLYDFLLGWDELYLTVEANHRGSLAEGRIRYAKNSLGLLKFESEQRLVRMKSGSAFVEEAPYFEPRNPRQGR